MERLRKLRLFNTVRQLKYNTHQDAHHGRRYDVAQQHCPHGVEKHGNHECKCEKEHFACPKKRQIPALGAWESRPSYTDRSGDNVTEIAKQMPSEHHESIERPEVKVLPAVKSIA